MAIKRSAPAQTGLFSPGLQGVLFFCCGLFLLSGSDGVVKYLSDYFSPLMIAVFRFGVQTAMVVVIAFVKGIRLSNLWRELTPVQIFRASFLVLASLQFIVAFKYLPLTDVIAIFFIQPMILTGLSAVVLKEDVGPRRWAAVLFGFIGVLVIVRPGSGIFGIYALLPVGAATAFALYLMMTRKLSGQASVLGAQLAIGLTGTIVMVPALLVMMVLGLGEPPVLKARPDSWLVPSFFLVFLAAFALAGQGLLIMAFERASASLLAPLSYVEIISATLIGFFFFNEIPDTAVWLGVGILAASGIYLAHRERIAARANKISPP
ncbi:DMT family transporter [Pseudovibrio exalbescens]|uniref:DMT family transporter n=1 Tax=Pseudovibrio exalbescens TaxID=197461 RepID=UPI000C9A81CA|nr:DMT family transporter [Pseudovibrio exalbescens]